ncbi:hypothetical protein TSMEX_004609 [Taenia solium]|eukprot:TsM_000966400 transcript=TsM_000966400 gene=TsM_000966400
MLIPPPPAMLLLLPLLLLWIIISCPSRTQADEYHVVAAGPCVEEGDVYCSRRVPNSFCSVTKNECFCQPAFVAIQEEYGITCKPRMFTVNH